METYDPEAIVNAERETWQRMATRYVDSTAKCTAHVVDVLIERANLGPKSVALEVGCGPGHITQGMANSGAKVIGVDLVPEMIEEATKRYPDIEFHQANVEQLPFEDEIFDVVLVNFSIHHFARPEVGCAEIRRVLKPGGRFLFAGPLGQCGFGAFIDALNKHHTLEVLAHGPIYLDASVQDYENLLRTAGFSDVHVEEKQQTLRLASLDPLIETGWGMCELDKLPESTQQAIRDDVQIAVAPYLSGQEYAFPDVIVMGDGTR